MRSKTRDPFSSPFSSTEKKEIYTRIWEFGLDHDEHLNNDYIMTAMADYGPGVISTELKEQ